MRGKTFDERTFVVLDEAQNTTPEQMKMFLTRIGEDSKVVVNGDIRQSDIRGANARARCHCAAISAVVRHTPVASPAR